MGDAVRLGIIGLGNMGTAHARSVGAGDVGGLRLTAVCDSNPRRVASAAGDSGIAGFNDVAALLASDLVDAVLVATPHYSHTPIGIAALDAGLHVLMEKPISVHKADCEALIAAHQAPAQVFAAMFNQRTDPRFRLIRDLVVGGDLGPVQRISWVITDWFRPDIYYRSGGWRATWAGEGGGVLLNQSPHQLDLLTWTFGMPSSVQAFCRFGRYHDIEVEDDVTAHLEYPDGATGIFVTSTGESPGTNRLEVIGDSGMAVVDGDTVTITRNRQSAREYSRTATDPFGAPETDIERHVVDGTGAQHLGILENFVAAIQHGEPLIAAAAEGIHSVELANAMLMSAFEDRRVELPLDAAAYAARLQERIDGSTRVADAPPSDEGPADLSGSFSR